MAIHKDVKKRLKTSLKEKERNQKLKSQLKTLIKKVETSPDPENLKKVFSSLDKASRKKVIHPNQASRIKSRLSKLLKQATTPGAESKAED